MKFYGQFNPPVDKVLYERYFKKIINGVSIECGAFDGITDNCTKFFEENNNWKTINIEPLPHIYDKLIVNRPNSINLNIALSNNNKDSIFTNYKHPILSYDWGNGSLTHTNTHTNELQLLCGKNNYITQVVKCNTYKDLINKLNIARLDLFILDVEGHEFEVIDGMKGATLFPDIFVIEHGHRSPKEIETKLQELPVSYKLDYISFVNSFFIKLKNTS